MKTHTDLSAIEALDGHLTQTLHSLELAAEQETRALLETLSAKAGKLSQEITTKLHAEHEQIVNAMLAFEDKIRAWEELSSTAREALSHDLEALQNSLSRLSEQSAEIQSKVSAHEVLLERRLEEMAGAVRREKHLPGPIIVTSLAAGFLVIALNIAIIWLLLTTR